MRSRKVYIVVAVVLLLIGGSFATLLWLAFSGNQIEKRLAQLRAAGEPVQLSDLTPEPIPSDQNIAAALDAVYPEISQLQAAFQKEKLFTEDPPQPLTNEQLSAIDAIIQEHSDVIEQLLDASELPHYASTVDFHQDPTLFITNGLAVSGRFREAARTVDQLVRHAVAKENWERVEKLLLAGFRLLEGFRTEPTLSNHLVGNACSSVLVHRVNELCRRHAFSDAFHAQLQQHLSNSSDQTPLVRAMVTERVLGLSLFGNYSQIGPPAIRWLTRAYWYRDIARYLDVVAEQIQEAKDGKLPPLPATSSTITLVDMTRNNFWAVRKAWAKTRVLNQCLSIAARQQHLIHQGKTPEGLEDLGLPPQMLVDPFDGKRLKLKQTPQGWTIYSVGENSVDDNGDIEKLDIGLAP